jgi:F-type H+-transporting ATPase subunit delta
MSQMNVIAYPYAQALFKIAKETNQQKAWMCALSDLSEVVSNQDFKDILNNPKVGTEQISSVIKSVLKQDANKEVMNLIEVLAANDRILALAEIYHVFRELVLEDQKRSDAIIETAYDMSKTEVEEFEHILSKKFGKTITATVKINPELIAGIKVTINDKVIDGSVKGRLDNLTAELTK